MLRLVRLLVLLALVVVSIGVPARPVVAAPTDLFFSEYIKGTSNNKALEIYNGTASSWTWRRRLQRPDYFNGVADRRTDDQPNRRGRRRRCLSSSRSRRNRDHPGRPTRQTAPLGFQRR